MGLKVRVLRSRIVDARRRYHFLSGARPSGPGRPLRTNKRHAATASLLCQQHKRVWLSHTPLRPNKRDAASLPARDRRRGKATPQPKLLPFCEPCARCGAPGRFGAFPWAPWLAFGARRLRFRPQPTACAVQRCAMPIVLRVTREARVPLPEREASSGARLAPLAHPVPARPWPRASQRCRSAGGARPCPRLCAA